MIERNDKQGNDKQDSCIGIRYEKLFEAAKIHFQIMRFLCCLNMAFNLTKPIWALICLHDITRESVAALTDRLADAFVRENVSRIYDVMTFRTLTLTPFCLEKPSVRKGIF